MSEIPNQRLLVDTRSADPSEISSRVIHKAATVLLETEADPQVSIYYSNRAKVGTLQRVNDAGLIIDGEHYRFDDIYRLEA